MHDSNAGVRELLRPTFAQAAEVQQCRKVAEKHFEVKISLKACIVLSCMYLHEGF
jgi:hypothetical protein